MSKLRFFTLATVVALGLALGERRIADAEPGVREVVQEQSDDENIRELRARGLWWERPAGSSEEWDRVRSTPGKVTIEAGWEYRFEFTEGDDDTLKKFARGVGGESALASLAIGSVASPRRDQALSADGLAGLASLPGLQDLSFTGCTFNEAGVKAIGAVRTLDSLRFWDCAIVADSGVAALGELRELWKLEFMRSSMAPSGTGGANPWESLKELSGLTYLDLAVSQFAAGDLQYVGALKSLETLVLQQCRAVTDAELHHLRELGAIQVLNLHETRITDRGLAESLPPFPSLRTLGLADTEVTDAGVRSLARYPKLEALALIDADQVAALDFGDLSLVQLDLRYCGLITDASLAHLAESQPNLELLVLTRPQSRTPA